MKSRIFVLMIVLMAAVSGCSLLDFFYTGQAENIRITTATMDGVIFTGENAEAAGVGFDFSEPIIDYWTLTEADVAALEAGLPTFLESEIPPDHYNRRILERLDLYKRQYFGITLEAGQPLIYANFFCVDEFDYWLESLVFVMDGGECFFQLLYDPASAEFSRLRVNGFA
jgi:hypothetical protein